MTEEAEPRVPLLAEGGSQGAPPNPEGAPSSLDPSEGAPQEPEGSPRSMGSPKGNPQDPEGSSDGAPPNPQGSPKILGSSKEAPPNPEGSPSTMVSSKGAPQDPEAPHHILDPSEGAHQDPEGPPNVLGSSRGTPQEPEESPNAMGSSRGAPQDPEGSPNAMGSSKVAPQDPEGSPHIPEGYPNSVGSSKGAPQDPEGPSRRAPQDPEGSPNTMGSSRGSPQDPEGFPHIPEGSPNTMKSSRGAPQDPEGSPNTVGSSKGPPQDPEVSPNTVGSNRGAPQDPEGPLHVPEVSPNISNSSKGAPQDPWGSPHTLPPNSGPPQALLGPPLADLGALRAALEAALRREPGEPMPSELRPLLGVPLPPQNKCRHLDGARLLRDNLSLDSGGALRGLGGLRTALSILEKYGRNLLQPRPPRHWRGVRYGNPVFRSTVGAIQGGRGVLRLLGYTEETGEGLSFPPGVGTPHGPRVAAVTADVLVLRTEIDLLLANQHPNPQFFTDLLARAAEDPLVPDARPTLGGGRNPGSAPQHLPSPTCGDPSLLPPKWPYGTCQPPGSMGQPPSSMGQPPSSEGRGWACASCTFLNPGPSVLCGVCERPRLARRPPPAPQGWPCPHCTYWNEGPDSTCAVCRRPLVGEAPPPEPCPLPHPDLAPPSPAPSPTQEAERRRQQRLWEDGKRLVAIVRAAEAQGVPAEAVWAQAQALGGSPWGAVGQARGALGAALGVLVRSGEGEAGEALGPLSLREAAKAWIRAHGNPQRAKLGLLGARRRQLRALAELGFPERAEAAAALYQNGGDPWGAAGDLQRGRLRALLERCWEPEPPWDFEGPDLQALSRRVLAALPVPSWGRAALVATLGRELGLGTAASPAALRELLEAVRGCPDRGTLRRRLRPECAVCGVGHPRHRMLGLAWCQCPLCPECFRQHFRIAVRERGVGALGCPGCARPDLAHADDAARLGYFSTLDVQLRQFLDPATYQLFTQKLTELELLRDPQFLWCPQCSFGFIFEAEQGPAQCPQCSQRCCPRCRQPWDPAHASLSCAEFQAWLSARDPQAPAVGLAAFLQEQRLACPQCGLALALARGGCLHCRCPRCLHHFCSACARPFYRRDCCPDPQCPLRGSLHGHHPRRCLFYLRDWEPARLQQLLTDAGVPFETEPPPSLVPPPGGGCAVLEQKEAPGGLRDEACGRDTAPGQGGLCRVHYTEYLAGLVAAHELDVEAGPSEAGPHPPP